MNRRVYEWHNAIGNELALSLSVRRGIPIQKR